MPIKSVYDFYKLFDSHLEGPRLNFWIKSGPIRIYLRKTNRFFNGNQLPTIDVANISIIPRFQRKGLFTACLNYIEKHPLVKLVYIENVMGTSLENGNRLVAYLKRRGYEETTNHGFSPCLIKYVGESHEANKGDAEAGATGRSVQTS